MRVFVDLHRLAAWICCYWVASNEEDAESEFVKLLEAKWMAAAQL